MKLSDKQFQSACEVIAKDTFKFMKRKLTRQLNIISKGDPNRVDVNTVVNIIIASCGILDGNMITIAASIFKGITGDNINMNKLLLTHNTTLMKFVDSVEDKKEKLN